MKRIFIAGYMLAAALLASSAIAADLEEAAPEPVAIESVQAFNWSGGYVGAVGTYGLTDLRDEANPAATEKALRGGLGGITFGYNYQFDNGFVLGGEADAMFGRIGKGWGGENQFDPYYGEDKINAMGSFRVRAGYAFDWFLPYVTGGVAWANFDHSLGCDAARTVATRGCQNRVAKFDTSASDFDFGYTIGAGAEAAVTEHVTLKMQYLFSDFGNHKVTLNDPNYPGLGDRDFGNGKVHTFTLGVNYKF